MGALAAATLVEDGGDLVGCLVGVAADLELDQRRMAVLRDLVRVAGASGERTC